jgi:hypothetical protein
MGGPINYVQSTKADTRLDSKRNGGGLIFVYVIPNSSLLCERFRRSFVCGVEADELHSGTFADNIWLTMSLLVIPKVVAMKIQCTLSNVRSCRFYCCYQG